MGVLTNFFSEKSKPESSQVEPESRSYRLNKLLEEICETDAGLTTAALAIAHHIQKHRDLRTIIVDGKSYHLIGTAKDEELLRLEHERNSLLAQFHRILAEYSPLKQAIEGIR
jgi:hypothetical protein